MEKKYEGKTFDELKEMFSKAIADFEAEYNEAKATVDILKAKRNAQNKVANALFSELNIGRLHFGADSVSIDYVDCSEENTVVNRTWETSFWTYRLDECSNTKNLKDYYSHKISRELGQFISLRADDEHTTLQMMADLVTDAQAAVDRIDDGFFFAFKEILKKHESYSKCIHTIIDEYEEKVRTPGRILVAMVEKWVIEHPVESLKNGDRVYLTNDTSAWTVDHVDDKFVYLNYGRKCRHTTIDLEYMARQTDWFSEMNKEASSVQYKSIRW